MTKDERREWTNHALWYYHHSHMYKSFVPLRYANMERNSILTPRRQINRTARHNHNNIQPGTSAARGKHCHLGRQASLILTTDGFPDWTEQKFPAVDATVHWFLSEWIWHSSHAYIKIVEDFVRGASSAAVLWRRGIARLLCFLWFRTTHQGCLLSMMNTSQCNIVEISCVCRALDPDAGQQAHRAWLRSPPMISMLLNRREALQKCAPCNQIVAISCCRSGLNGRNHDIMMFTRWQGRCQTVAVHSSEGFCGIKQ